MYTYMPARVIDIDQNGNTGDPAAMWLPGETYITPTLGIEVSVLSATETGFVVNISNRFTRMEDVEIVGASRGYYGESIPFTATITPVDSTTPITYTWEATGLPPVVHVGGTVDQIDFNWEEIGTKAITVTASNDGGTVMDTHLIKIGSKVPIVTLYGPTESRVGLMNIFTATVVPLDVVQPITYTWQASGQMPITNTAGISDSVSYVWDDPGTQVITVTAMNIFGSTTDQYKISVFMPPANLEVTGPEAGDMQGSYTFTATVSPITTTVPITYEWFVDDQLAFTHTTGTFDSVTFTWVYPGFHQIDVLATNRVGTVVDTWTILIYIRFFLPVSMRN
jgi:hypothetical protein